MVAVGSQSKDRILCHARINPPLCPAQSCMSLLIHCFSLLPEKAHLHITGLTDHTVYDFCKRVNAKYKNRNIMNC